MQKKKTHSPLIALILFVFLAFTILYNESYIQGIQPADDKNGRPSLVQGGSLINSKPSRNLNLSNESPGPVGLDKFTKCASTARYSVRRGVSAINTAGFGGRRAASEVEPCDLFSGKWVLDNMSYPLYNESDCPYMSDQLACQKHGRPDSAYQFWRWQPHGCNLNRWDAREMWEKLRGKRLMFVGDSLNRGQWVSMMCLLQSVIPANKRSITPNSELTAFRAEDYNATVEFLWAPFLVESNCDNAVDHRLNETIIRADSVLRHSSRWEQADILVFNSYLWWRQGTVKLLWSNEEGGSVCEEISGIGGMELAMESWADWVATHVDPSKTKVFFVSMSPTHQLKGEWEPGSKGNCYTEETPIADGKYWGSGSDKATMRMVEAILNRLGSKVFVLNITQLSEYRKDGHPTIYRKFWDAEKSANPADCIHWCLPGVPDVWNELLFQFL